MVIWNDVAHQNQEREIRHCVDRPVDQEEPDEINASTAKFGCEIAA